MLYDFFVQRSAFREGLAWTERALAAPATDPALRSEGLYMAGSLAHQLGDYERSHTYADACQTLAHTYDHPVGVAWAHYLLSFLARDARDYDQAVDHAERAVACFEAVGDVHLTAYGVMRLGLEVLGQGDPSRAAALFEASLATLRAVGDERGVAMVTTYLGLAELDRGHVERARRLHQESLHLQVQSVGEQWMLLQLVMSLGFIAGLDGQHERAARLLGAAEAMLREIQFVPYGRYWDLYEASLAAGRAALGEVAFAVAMAQGQTMGIDAAVKEALTVRLRSRV